MLQSNANMNKVNYILNQIQDKQLKIIDQEIETLSIHRLQQQIRTKNHLLCNSFKSKRIRMI